MMHSMMMRNYFHPRRVPARVPDTGDLKMIASITDHDHDASDPGVLQVRTGLGRTNVLVYSESLVKFKFNFSQLLVLG